MIDERTPDLALLDLRMPGRDALQLLASSPHHEPPVGVVVLSAYTDRSPVHSAMAAGALAYVAKDAILEILVDVAAAFRSTAFVPNRASATDLENMHGIDERVSITALNDGTDMVERILRAVATGETALDSRSSPQFARELRGQWAKMSSMLANSRRSDAYWAANSSSGMPGVWNIVKL